MKNISILMFLVFLFSVAGFGLAIGIALATVGGPTFIHTFNYNPVDESVYYVVNSFGGRGCPPELVKLSLNSSEHQVVYSCDEGEKLIRDGNYDTSLANTEINKITKNFKNLTPINLSANRISVDVNFVDYTKFEEIDEIINANFIASVYQDNEKVVDLPISGCNLKQPFTFAGYAIPGFEKKIVLLLSTRGNCFEGGYIGETLHVVGGVDDLDKNYFSNFYKDSSALVPSEGTLVVFEADTINVPVVDENENENANLDEPQTEEKESPPFVIWVLSGLALLLIGMFLGGFSRMQKNKT